MSMTRDQLLRFINDPSALNERTLGELREILDEYPYFQSAHLLYVRNLQQEHNFRFASQLKTCAVYSADRTVLYHLLNSIPSKQIISVSGEENHALNHDDQLYFELSDGQTEKAATSDQLVLAGNHRDNNRIDLLNFEHTNMPYVFGEDETKAPKPLADLAKEIGHMSVKKEKVNEPEQKDDLIDRFIKENPPFMVRQQMDSERTKVVDKQVDSPEEGEEFITETLARIYMKQGLYQKSIIAFQRLSLKYPEKSVYFARQIEEVTNLINK
jgi:tetratricopeptide (TPR) repeat protein